MFSFSRISAYSQNKHQVEKHSLEIWHGIEKEIKAT